MTDGRVRPAPLLIVPAEASQASWAVSCTQAP